MIHGATIEGFKIHTKPFLSGKFWHFMGTNQLAHIQIKVHRKLVDDRPEKGDIAFVQGTLVKGERRGRFCIHFIQVNQDGFCEIANANDERGLHAARLQLVTHCYGILKEYEIQNQAQIELLTNENILLLE